MKKVCNYFTEYILIIMMSITYFLELIEVDNSKKNSSAYLILKEVNLNYLTYIFLFFIIQSIILSILSVIIDREKIKFLNRITFITTIVIYIVLIVIAFIL